MLNSAPFTSLAGNVWIEINAGSTVIANVDLLEMGTIDYEFDLMPSDQEVTVIGGMPGATSVVFSDTMSNRASLYDTLFNRLSDYDPLQTDVAPKAIATVYLQLRGQSNIFRFPFEFRAADLSLDERSKKTKISLSPKTSNINVGQWVNGATSYVPSKISYRSGDKFFVNSWASGDFIYSIINDIDNAAGASTIYRSGDLGKPANLPNSVFAFERLTDILNSPTNIQISSYSSLMFVHDTDMYFANANTVMSKLQAFAGMEGAIFGSAFSVNFYINRLTNSINVVLSNSDLVDLSFTAQTRDIKGVGLSFTNTNKTDNPEINLAYELPKITNASSETPGWILGSRSIASQISAFYPQLNRGVYNNVDNFVDGDNDALAFYNDQLLARFGADSYSFGAFGAFKVELDILGINKIKPYQVIKFDNTVPVRYQNRHFRPTSLSYDLKGDRVKVTAYSIDDFILVPPTTTTTTAGTTTTTTTIPPIYIGNSKENACISSTVIELTFSSGATFCNTFQYFGDFSAYSFGTIVWLKRGNDVLSAYVVSVGRATRETNCDVCSGTTTTTTTGGTTTTTTAAGTTTTTTAAGTTTTTTAGGTTTTTTAGGTTTTTTAGGTTTTTTAAGTTTTTTGGTTTSTTSTTTVFTAPPINDIAQGTDGADACANYPGAITLYGNDTTFAASTIFYTDDTLSTLFQGGNQFYSNGAISQRINNSGVRSAQENCAGTTTTTTAGTTTTTTAAGTTTTTTTAGTTTTTTAGTTTTTTTTQPPCQLFVLYQGANAAASCDSGTSVVIYGNNNNLASVTQFYENDTCTTAYNGGNQWFSDRFGDYTSPPITIRIASDGSVLASEQC
jgi:hypothetical protein